MDLIIGLLVLVGAIIGLSFFLYSVKQIKFTYWLSIICVFIPINYINRYFAKLPSFAKWMPLSIIFICFLAIITRHLFRKKIVIPKQLSIFFLGLFSFALLSFIANQHTTIVSAIFSSMGLLSFILFTLILNNKDYYLDNLTVFRLLIGFGIFSSIAAFFQRLVLVELLHINSGDMVTGLLSLDGHYTFYQLFCFIVIFIFWLHGKEIFKRVSNPKLAMLFLASIAVSDDKASLIFLPLIFLIIFFHVRKRLLLKKIKTLLLLFFLLVLSIVLLNFFSKDKTNDPGFISLMLDPDYVQNNLFGNKYDVNSEYAKNGELKRGTALTFNVALISRSTENLVFGKGPGVTSEAQVPGGLGYLSKMYQDLDVGRSSYSQIIAELGFGGILLLLVFLALTYFWKNSPDEPLEYILVRRTTVVLLLLYFAYENLFRSWAFSLVLGSLFILPYQAKSKAKKLNKKVALQY